MTVSRSAVVIRSRVTVGTATALVLVLLVIAGAVLLVATKERPRDFTGFAALLVPLVGATALTRGDLAAGVGAALLSLALGYVLGVAVTVLAAVASLV